MTSDMAEVTPGDANPQPLTSKKKTLKVILEIWRDCNRDPIEFSRRMNAIIEDAITEKETYNDPTA